MFSHTERASQKSVKLPHMYATNEFKTSDFLGLCDESSSVEWSQSKIEDISLNSTLSNVNN